VIEMSRPSPCSSLTTSIRVIQLEPPAATDQGQRLTTLRKPSMREFFLDRECGIAGDGSAGVRDD
jgi:hypothetical protein